MSSHDASRRRFLARGGALIISFALVPKLAAQPTQESGKPPALPGSLEDAPMLDSWIRIGADGSIIVFTGKAELGQGIRTALIQVAAEELMIEPRRISLITADTAQTPDEAYTAGSQSMQHSGTAIMNAAAQVRTLLLGMASQRLHAAVDQLMVENGVIRAPNGGHIAYAELVKGQQLHVRAEPKSQTLDPNARKVMGQSMQRVDIPGKVTGAPAYVHDLRLPGMVHARVVRPPSYGARLLSLDTNPVARLPGVLKIVRDGSFLGVITDHEYQAVVAMRALAANARWQEGATLPPRNELAAYLQRLPTTDRVDVGEAAAPTFKGDDVLEATFHRPYQMHGAIGPSCAVAVFRDDSLTVWTHSQGVYPLRKALAELLHLPLERVRCIHMEGSGCYGHNAADDAGADAALLARALPGRPVRVQWMREQEHTWEPYGSAMAVKLQARLTEGFVADWNHEVWSCTHDMRPGPAGNLLAGQALQEPFEPRTPRMIPLPAGGGDRNAVPLYKFGNTRVIYHFIEQMPIRVSALRALGAYANVFAVESFMDELAKKASVDPIEFRLRHLADPRGRDVVQMVAERFGWTSYRGQPGRGRGFAYARYKTLAAFAAIAFEVDVDTETGRIRIPRVVAAIDSGEAVNPDGIRNQTEGGIIQSISWTLHEALDFDARRITSRNWSSYPILRFNELPDMLDVYVINRPGQPFLGTGEAAQGPTAAALVNAVTDATGVRVRDLPLTARRLKAAIGV